MTEMLSCDFNGYPQRSQTRCCSRVLLLSQLNIVTDAVLVEELVELLGIQSVRAFHLAIQAWCPRPDVDMPNGANLEMPMDSGLKLRAVVRLNGEPPGTVTAG